MTTTLTLQLATFAVVIVAATSGRYAERHGDTGAGILAVCAGIVAALLFTVLLYRGHR